MREAGTWAVMTAYNRVQRHVLQRARRSLIAMLRDEWGFDGVVMSDWYGTHSTAPAAQRGPRPRDARAAAVVRRRSSPTRCARARSTKRSLDDKVRRVLDAARAHRPARRRRARTPRSRIDDPVDRAIVPPRRGRELRAAAERRRASLPLAPTVTTTARGHRPERRRRGDPGRRQRARRRRTRRSRRSPGSASGSATRCRRRARARLLQLQAHAGARRARCSTGRCRSSTSRAANASGEPVLRRTRRPRAVHVHRPGRRTACPTSSRCASRGTLVAPETGEWTFALVQVGRARLSLDGEVVVDNWNPTGRSDAFMGFGSAEADGHDRSRPRASRTRSRSSSCPPRGFGGLEIGCTPPDAADLMDRAVALARARRRRSCASSAPTTTGRPRATTASRWRCRRRRTSSSARSRRSNPRTVVVVNAASPVDDAVGRRRRRDPAVLVPGRGVGQRARRRADGRRLAVGQAADDASRSASRTRPRSRTIRASAGEVRYGEGVFVGYRWYDARRHRAAVLLRARALVHDVRARRTGRIDARCRSRARRCTCA